MNGSEDEISPTAEDRPEQTPVTEIEITPELLETTRKKIEEDQQSWVDSMREEEDPDDPLYLLRPSDETIKWDNYFNNWHDILPGSFLRENSEKMGLMDIPNPLDYPGHTDLIRGKTFRGESAEVDRAIDEEGLDRDRIKELVEAVENNNAARSSPRIDINKYTFPAFVRLQARGYNWNDLTS